MESCCMGLEFLKAKKYPRVSHVSAVAHLQAGADSFCWFSFSQVLAKGVCWTGERISAGGYWKCVAGCLGAKEVITSWKKKHTPCVQGTVCKKCSVRTGWVMLGKPPENHKKPHKKHKAALNACKDQRVQRLVQNNTGHVRTFWPPYLSYIP